jgi:hypothetical protein
MRDPLAGLPEQAGEPAVAAEQPSWTDPMLACGARKCVHAARRYSCRRPASRSRGVPGLGGWPLMRGYSSGWIRRLRLQRPVGVMSVVVRDGHLEGPLQMPAAHDQ